MSTPLRFLTPTDWQQVDQRHAIRFEWPVGESPPPVEVFAKAPFVRWTSAAGAMPAPVTRIASVRDRSGSCLARPRSDLPCGEFVLGVRPPGAPAFTIVSGVLVLGRSGPVATHLPRLLCARATCVEAGYVAPAAVAGEPLFSVTTTVFDTDPGFLDELAACLRDQICTDYEWLLLDNGSTRPDTVARVREIAAADPRIRYVRLDENVHIVPGNRRLLESARGRYIVPVDSDDIVYRDALALLSQAVTVPDPPAVVFSEECKVDAAGVPMEYVWRPGFSPLHALSTCPAAHVMAIDRRAALAADLYSGGYARGSHDWDSCLRLLARDAAVERIPHVLYGWRMHSGSSAKDEGAKDYLRASQVEVLRRALDRRGLGDRFAVEGAHGDAFGFYHLRRLEVAPRPIAVDFVVRDAADAAATLRHDLAMLDYPAVVARVVVVGPEADAVRAVTRAAGLPASAVVSCAAAAVGREVSTAPDGVFAKVIVDADLRLERRDWLWDVLGTFELDPGTGVVGGSILDLSGCIQHIGYYGGLDGFVATPRHGQHPVAVTGLLAFVRRGVTAVHGGFLAVRADVFDRVGSLLDVDRDDGIHGVEFCLRCRDRGIGVGFTPGFAATRARPLRRHVGEGHELRRLLLAAGKVPVPDPYYSGLLARSADAFGDCEFADAGASAAPVASGGAVRVPNVVEWARGVSRNAAHRVWRLVSRRPWRVRMRRWASEPQPAAADGVAVGPETAPLGPPQGLLTPADPLHFAVDPALAARPTLVVLLPGIGMESMSGGPNTVFNLCYRMAAGGVPVRFVATSMPMSGRLDAVWEHVQSLSGVHERLPNVEFVDGHDRRKCVPLGANDVFFATAWWTAQMAKYALPLVRSRRFLYLIQDFEPVLHEHSTAHALALETYALPFVPIVNHRFLADYLRENRVGAFADASFAADCIVLDPAIDRTRFHPDLDRPRSGRRLLFYARPRTGKRNLFELGVAALQLAVERRGFAAEPWEFLAMGDPVSPVDLGHGSILRPAPWRDFDGYAEQMRSADLLLSLMLSPHPSYPPLEMAACGGLVVTNSYANKTEAALQAVSRNIRAPVPTVEAVATALCAAAAAAADAPARLAGAAASAPGSWQESFASVLPRAMAAFAACKGNS